MTPTDIFRHTALGQGLADIRQVTIADGPGAGGRLIEVRTPTGLYADIALDRGGDLLRLSYKGAEIGWHSNTRAPCPWPDSEAEHGLGFLRGFDGFMVTCGLDHHGVPAETSAEALLYPLRDNNVHPLHGRIAAQKAEVIEKQVDWDAGVITIKLRVQQASVFGENLELLRTYRFSLSRAEITIADRVTNRGFRPVRHGILYHFNAGYPFLNAESRLIGDDWTLRNQLDTGGAVPSDDHVEVVQAVAAPQDGHIGLTNGGAHALSIQFDPEALPVTALWQAFQSGTFALGLEPQTDLTDETQSRLVAGEQRDYYLTVSISGP